MLTFIKANYQIGDSIEVTCSEGAVTGVIEHVDSKYIVLRLPNGHIMGIAASDVRSFTAASPVPMVPSQSPVVKEPIMDEEAEAPVNALKEQNTESPTALQKEASMTLGDILGKEATEEAPSASDLIAPASVAEPKVIGQIDLSKIDPKYGRKKYFRSEEESFEEQNHREEVHAASPSADYFNYQRRPYVAAKGRVTYYNPDKRFGFIHDFKNDVDLYFYVNQVIETSLYQNLRKGVKVVYTPGRNNQGPAANCIHLPHTVDDLYIMAEDNLEAHRTFVAKGLLEHILEVEPDNTAAQELLEDVIENMPKTTAPVTTNTYNNASDSAGLARFTPCNLYTQAKKAYIAKDYERAEEFYLKAIEAGEKPDSSVKDLLTLYVSRFKQAETEEQKTAARQKAMDFFDAHRSLLEENFTTKQFIALNYYLPIQDYDRFLEMVDELMKDPQVGETLSRKVFYMWQKAIALNKQGRTQDALNLIEEGLQLMPLNRQLQMLRESILHPEPKDEAQSEIAPTETPAETETTPAKDETISEKSNSVSDEGTSATQSEAAPSANAPAENENEEA